MSKTILCAVDVSEKHDDIPVLQEAAQQAVLKGMSLDVVTVVPNMGVTLVQNHFSHHFQTEAVEEAKRRLTVLADRALAHLPDLEVRHIVAAGSVYEEILELAAKTKPFLIVIGAHRENLKDFFLGPNAARVVRHAECSVYVVRET